MNQRATSEEEHHLIEQFQNGYPEAMEGIVNLYEESLYNFGFRMCGGHKEDAEDILQETFLSAFRYLNSFREETKLKNWLYKIAANACRRKRRKKKGEPDFEISLEALLPGDGAGGQYEIPDWADDPAKRLLQSELKQVIGEAVHSLPPKYRIVFNLRDMEGFKTEETANILDISPQAVKTRLHRARLFLRQKISERYKKGLPNA
jgi:RNA polymerase sigma-70 factor (ECF subfamily)